MRRPGGIAAAQPTVCDRASGSTVGVSSSSTVAATSCASRARQPTASRGSGGVLDRGEEHEIDELPVSEHIRAYLREAFALDAEPELAERRFARYAHALG